MRDTCAAVRLSMLEIIPAVLPQSYEELDESLGRLLHGPRVVQIDTCDGVFVPTRTWPHHPRDRAHFARILRGDEGLPYWQDFDFEVDLMVHAPERHASQWVAAGVTRILFHARSRHDWAHLKDAVGSTAEIGIAIDLETPYDRLFEYGARVDYVQIMGIARLGVQGAPLDERVYALIERVRRDFSDGTIQIDGGVTLENARSLIDAGADRLVAGSAILGSGDALSAYRRLTEC